MSKEAVDLETKISKKHHQEDEGAEGEFSESKKASHLRAQAHALEADEKMFTKQAGLLSTETNGAGFGRSKRRAFLELFITSPVGLGVNTTGRGRRDPSDQSRFRAACIREYASKHPDPRRPSLWCPILKTWVHERDTTAAHIFAYMHGQDVMNSVFGSMESPELFSPLNGMIISTYVEDKFDRGFMAIVPRLPDHPTVAQMSLWNNSKPKQYKICILNFADADIDNFIGSTSDQTWRDLHDSPVKFKNDFRPRARYLYFHYCMQILRRAWGADNKSGQRIKNEFGKGYWGTIGPYLPKSMLLAFVEELGHEYKDLLVGSVDDKTTTSQEDRDLLLAVASNQVKASKNPTGENEDSDADSDEDEDEDENEDEEVEGSS